VGFSSPPSLGDLPGDNSREQPASLPDTYNITGDGLPSAPRLPVPVDGPETVDQSDEKDPSSHDEQGRRTFIVLDVAPAVILDRCHVDHSKIDVLSDDVLLYIFNLYQRRSRQSASYLAYALDCDYMWPWHTMVHVCQRWRRLIFAWPNHLEVRVECKSRTAVAKALDVWPALPISIKSWLNHEDGADIIAALEHRERIAWIRLLDLSGPQLKECVTLMQGPFPILRCLSLDCYANDVLVVTDAFLAGSASHLQLLKLSGVPFPTLPKFLLSASELVQVDLRDITSAGYVSPEAMATCLATLKNLQSLVIKFQSKTSFLDRTSRVSPPPTRDVLPALSSFMITGVSEYLEDLMARIHTPQLNFFNPQFFYQPIFDIPQLPQFIHRADKLKLPAHARIEFCEDAVLISLTSREDGISALRFYCTGLARQHSLFVHCLPLLSHIDTLELASCSLLPTERDTTPWLDFLRLFNSVEALHVDHEEVGMQLVVATALAELAPEETEEVLPMLKIIVGRFDSEEFDMMKPFLHTRSESGHPVEVMMWLPVPSPGADWFRTR
jgi:hypothetical protein